MVEYKVIDNFLSPHLFDKILSQLDPVSNYAGENISWNYCKAVGNREDTLNSIVNNMYFYNMIYCNTILSEKYYKILEDLIYKINVAALMRIKVNLYTRTESLCHHPDHCDAEFSHKGALFSLNTCDGFTVINGEEIPSVANRMILFDPSIPHHSTNCTNDTHRMNINFNYF